MFKGVVEDVQGCLRYTYSKPCVLRNGFLPHWHVDEDD